MPFHPEVEDTRYPKAGDPNPKAALLFARARDGRVVAADLGKYAKDQPLIVRVDWQPDGKRCVFEVQDREQTWLDVDLADPDSGQVETLLRDTSHPWVNVLDLPRWLADGSFLWSSERSGYKHVYHYDKAGKLIGPVTAGNWEVRAIVALDEAKKQLWFTANKE